MSANVARLLVVFFFLGGGAPDAKGFLLVDICTADGDGDGKDGDVHHDEVGNLYARVEVGKIYVSETGGTRRYGLEEAIENAIAGRADVCYCGVVKLERMLVRAWMTSCFWMSLHQGR